MNCEWAAWGVWTGCKVPAMDNCGKTGEGETSRTRIIGVAADHGGRECEADTLEDLLECCSLTPADGTSFTCQPSPTCPGMKFVG